MRRSEHDGEIVRLAVPAFGALVAEPLYVLADTAVVGHLGTPQLAGLAVASSALLTGYALCTFLAYGTTASIARLLGAGDEREAAREAVQGLWLALLVATVLVTAGLAFGDQLVRALGAGGEVATHAALYLRVSLLGVPALLVGLAGTGWLRGRRDTRTPLLVALGANVVNLGAEIGLIYGLGLGIGASAAATVAAQWLAASVYVTRVIRPARALGVSLRPDPAVLLQLARAGTGLVVRTVSLQGSLTLATVVAAHIGPDDIAGHQIAYQVWTLLALALDAVAIAGQALVGGELGAGDAARARALSRRMLEVGVAFGVACGVVVLLLRPFLPHVFTDDPAVARLAAFLLVFVALLQPLAAVVFVLDGILIGAGDQAYLARAMLGAAAVFAVAAAAVVVLGLGIGWLWAGLALFIAARATGVFTRWRGGAWAVTGARTA